MKKAELFKINVTPDFKNVEITLSQIARWAPEILKVYTIPLTDFLDFLELCFKYFNKESEIPVSGLFSVEAMESQVKLVMDNEIYFTTSKSGWKTFIKQLVEHLYLQGAITI